MASSRNTPLNPNTPAKHPLTSSPSKGLTRKTTIRKANSNTATHSQANSSTAPQTPTCKPGATAASWAL